jgi:hypothetical protein
MQQYPKQPKQSEHSSEWEPQTHYEESVPPQMPFPQPIPQLYQQGYSPQQYPQPYQQGYMPQQYPQPYPMQPPPQPWPGLPYPYQQQIPNPPPMSYIQAMPYYQPIQPQITIMNNVTTNANAQILGYRRPEQLSFLVRFLYFIFIGWWVGLYWVCFALFFCMTIIGIPLGLIMLNKLPAVFTLQRS